MIGLRPVIFDGSRAGAPLPAVSRCTGPAKSADLGSRPERARRVRMWADKCLPATLDEQQAVAALAVCERFAGSVLEHAAGREGLRIGAALGLRHNDIDVAARVAAVSTRVNLDGARAKSGSRQIPLSVYLIRLYSDYLMPRVRRFAQRLRVVSLWAELVGAPMTYRSVYDLVLRLRKRSGVVFPRAEYRAEVRGQAPIRPDGCEAPVRLKSELHARMSKYETSINGWPKKIHSQLVRPRD